MGYKVEKLEGSMAKLIIDVSAEEFDAACEKAYQKNKKRISVPGFRAGKVPKAMLEKMYGKEVFYQDAMDDLAPEAFSLGVKEGELRVVGQPRISDVNVTDEKACEFTFDVTTYPEVVLGEYKVLPVTMEMIMNGETGYN